MQVEDFDYELPKELIAQEPANPRDSARLMVLHRESGAVEHKRFWDIGEFLRPGDVLVLNDTRVIPARLWAEKTGSGGKVEVLLLEQREPGLWEALVRPGRRVRPGAALSFGGGALRAQVVEALPYGGRLLRFDADPRDLPGLIDQLGETPLPPYIRRRLEDPEQYQTVYSRVPGSVAAPTAGLHFTPELLQRLQAQGIALVYLTLQVGLGTFRPVKVDRVEEHHMHEEFYSVSPEAAAFLNRCRRAGGRLVAVGTTVVRTLETVADETGEIHPGAGWTGIFIYPGYRFRAVDALITNFHLPRSTLLMLVSAFAGREQVLAAYRQAIALRYRFYSFGDAMLIL
ncbi:MAG: tRNA preQ1(34) S-adenosylmethionine ribosyltransferase-isomerase QueA [Firmicutes bacterium]|nr:tRNA preQ1(34) S-adenosylmethionine ribosyltransferase-isomerase QueA [Bacillota bacterium]